jgi:copper transport protein
LAPRLFSKTQAAGSGPTAMLVNVIVDPAKTGPNTVHVYTQNPNGSDLPVRGMSADFYMAAQNLKIPANLTRAGSNHFLTNGLLITTPGKWQFVLHVTRVIQGELEDTATVVNVPVR